MSIEEGKLQTPAHLRINLRKLLHMLKMHVKMVQELLLVAKHVVKVTSTNQLLLLMSMKVSKLYQRNNLDLLSLS